MADLRGCKPASRCSELVLQLTDTKDQIKYSIQKNNSVVFKKGDIIFWKGHVAVCINSQKLIHAYGPEKKVLIMNITETINRIERTAKLIVKKISSIKY